MTYHRTIQEPLIEWMLFKVRYRIRHRTQTSSRSHIANKPIPTQNHYAHKRATQTHVSPVSFAEAGQVLTCCQSKPNKTPKEVTGYFVLGSPCAREIAAPGHRRDEFHKFTTTDSTLAFSPLFLNVIEKFVVTTSRLVSALRIAKVR